MELVHFAAHRDVRPDAHPYLRFGEQAVLRGQAVIKALEQLRAKAFAGCGDLSWGDGLWPVSEAYLPGRC